MRKGVAIRLTHTPRYFCSCFPRHPMRSADNRVISVLSQYREQLGGLYLDGEVKAIARTVFHDRLGWDPSQMEIRKFEPLSESDLLKVYLPLKRLRTGEPVQYVLGRVRFHGLTLRVTPDVLIPRPETEELVQLIIEAGHDLKFILDMGTGSGCIALALKNAFPDARVVGVDSSEAALVVAAGNSADHALQVEWVHADVLSAAFSIPSGVDLVVSNPPYIPREDEHTLAAQVSKHEPHAALFTPESDPLLFYRVIGDRAFKALSKGGQLWLEGHWMYASMVGELLEQVGFTTVRVLKDLSGKDRIIHAER